MRVNMPVTSQEYVLAEDEQIVSRTDLQSHITYCNDAFCTASGFSREELLGQPQNIVRHPDMPAAAFADLWATIGQGKPWTGLVKNRRKDGGFYWVRANVTPLFQNGQVLGYMSVRTKPSSDEVRNAQALYAQLQRGDVKVRLEGGLVMYSGLRGLLQRLNRSSFGTRAWATSAAFAALFTSMGLLSLMQPSVISTFILLLSLVGLGASVAFGLWCASALSRPLQIALEQARRIAGNEVNMEFDLHGDPILKQLLRQMNQIKVNLVGILQDVHKRTDRVSAAAGEVASGNHNLSQRTEQQAANLEETASSMEQLNATVQQNSDNARQASVLARNASDIAQEGGQVVSQVAENMHSIDQASKEISTIVGLIDSIALQTNLLALNAAVEAARAGEQGRGFAIVAGEVRSLAQRSAAAAHEIKDLIETSAKRIRVGSGLATQASETISEVVNAVKRVTTIVNEIASASEEQSLGIAQVNQAVTQMDQVTQQNATLVEKLAAAADNVQEQTKAIQDAMAALRLSKTPAAAPRAASRQQPAATTSSPQRKRA